jgi:hypothetical protein
MLERGLEMDKEEFFVLYAAVAAMPEAENPALYQRSRRCFERLHKLREQGWASKIVGNDFSPPPVARCPDCTPGELCYAHELLTILDEYKKRRPLAAL